MVTRLTKSIRVSKEIYDKLARQGTVSDSFDDVIRGLMKKEKPQVRE
jgi:predicted CopG family antitoxin